MDVLDLVSCEWLNERLDQVGKTLIIIDVSWSSTKDMEEEYHKSHIEGARYLNVMEADHNEMFPRNLPDPEIFQSRVRDIGVNDNSHLVLYSNSDMSGFFMSGRAWLTFKHFGPDELKVSILDGGLQKWIAENRPTKSTKDEEEQGKPKVEPGNFTRKENDTYVMKYDKMVDVANSNSKQICDSRPNAKYQDKTGHIKGAANLPLSQLLENGVLKSVDSIKEGRFHRMEQACGP